MRRLPEAAPSLVGDPARFLGDISEFVRSRGLGGQEPGWREVVRVFGDGHGFLDFSAWRVDGVHARVLIEFGVEHHGERHRAGFFDGYWGLIDADLRQVMALALDGKPADLQRFAAVLQSYLRLPLLQTEIAEAV